MNETSKATPMIGGILGAGRTMAKEFNGHNLRMFSWKLSNTRDTGCVLWYISDILISHEWSWSGNLYGPGEIWPDILEVSYHGTTTQQIDNN